MAMAASFSNGETPEAQRPSGARFFGPSQYVAEVFDGADDALAALEAVQGGQTSTGFQTLDWLIVLYEELAPSSGLTPRVVVVSDRDSGGLAMALPLLIEKTKMLRTARFADLGIADYAAPILGPAAPTDARAARRAWKTARASLKDIDLIAFERMPKRIGAKANPLLLRGAPPLSRQCGHVIAIDGTVDDYVASRGKKFRKEAARCLRVLERAGEAKFYRATAPDDIARVFSVLDDQQAARHAELGSDYVLDRPEYRAFYERLVMDGSDAGLSYLFALEAGGETVAALFGIVHDGAFTLLRISTGGEKWKHVSPGRTIILEAMRYLAARGVTKFDMGIGSYPFKSDFGPEEVPLFDVYVARRIGGAPAALLHRIKARLRQNARLAGAYKYLTAGRGAAAEKAETEGDGDD